MGQTYVEDPAFTLAGSEAATGKTADKIIGLWLILGLGLSWKKGGYHDGLASR